MREALIFQKINQILATQKKMDEFLVEQKYIVADMVIRIRFLESKLNVGETEYEDFKETFVAQLQKHKEDLKSGIFRSKITGSDVNDGQDSGSELPGDKSN